MFSVDIPPGKVVQVKTKGDKKRLDIAPPLIFKGRLVNITEHYIEISYTGEKVVLNTRGKVIGTEQGLRLQRIYGSTIESVRGVGR